MAKYGAVLITYSDEQIDDTQNIIDNFYARNSKNIAGMRYAETDNECVKNQFEDVMDDGVVAFGKEGYRFKVKKQNDKVSIKIYDVTVMCDRVELREKEFVGISGLSDVFKIKIYGSDIPCTIQLKKDLIDGKFLMEE